MSVVDDELNNDKVTRTRKPKNWQVGFTMVDNRIFWQGVNLTSDAKVTYAALKSFENEKTKQCNPSYSKIIERSGLTRGRVADAIEELEAFEWIAKKKRFSGSTYYTLTCPKIYQVNEDGEREGLAPDQTCPTKFQARRWKEHLKTKHSQGKKGWSPNAVKATAQQLERKKAEWDEIPW